MVHGPLVSALTTFPKLTKFRSSSSFLRMVSLTKGFVIFFLYFGQYIVAETSVDSL